MNSEAINFRRRNQCLGKFAYDDPYVALREMFALPYRTGISEYDLSLYRCVFCDYWHLGTMARKNVRYIEPTEVPSQMQGQQIIKFKELKDYSPMGYRNTRRDGEPYR